MNANRGFVLLLHVLVLAGSSFGCGSPSTKANSPVGIWRVEDVEVFIRDTHAWREKFVASNPASAEETPELRAGRVASLERFAREAAKRERLRFAEGGEFRVTPDGGTGSWRQEEDKVVVTLNLPAGVDSATRDTWNFVFSGETLYWMVQGSRTRLMRDE